MAPSCKLELARFLALLRIQNGAECGKNMAVDFGLGMGTYYIIFFCPILVVVVVTCLNAKICGLRFGAALHHKNAAKADYGSSFL